jgi:hypothetical protein
MILKLSLPIAILPVPGSGLYQILNFKAINKSKEFWK